MKCECGKEISAGELSGFNAPHICAAPPEPVSDCECGAECYEQPAEPPAVRERAEKWLIDLEGEPDCGAKNGFINEVSELMAAFAAEELSAFVREVEARRDSHGVSEDFEASMRAVLKEREGRR